MRYADSRCRCLETHNPHVYTFVGPCIITGKETSVSVPAEALHAYRRGACIQDAMPMLTPDEREFLISGVGSPEAWESLFSEK